MTENALVYAVDGNEKYVDCMVNSINSFCATNPSLVESTPIFVLAKSQISLNGIDKRVKPQVISSLSCDYSKIKHMDEYGFKRFGGEACFYKFEIFKNKAFRKFDNVLYLDCDTEFKKPIGELFQDKTVPGIYLVEENESMLEIPLKHYWNSGIILATVKSLKKSLLNEFFGELIRTAKKFPERYVDQDAMNRVLDQDKFSSLVLPMGPEYNLLPGTTRKPFSGCKIKHYAGTNAKYRRRYLKK